jgi:phosphoglycolate phosphatase
LRLFLVRVDLRRSAAKLLAMKPTRLALFDIDGTILTTHRKAWEDPFRDAIEEAFREDDHPLHVDTSKYRAGGKTDTQIIYEILGENGIAETETEKLLPAIRLKYLSHLRAVLQGRTDYVVLKPGIWDLLEELHRHSGILLGLLTGNFEEGARIKLDVQGLNHYFAFGAYGENARQRDELPQRALEAAEKATGFQFSKKQIVIIGDTPNDIHCGQHLGVRTIAVATGPFTHEQLQAEKPDFIFPNFLDKEKVVQAILSVIPEEG